MERDRCVGRLFLIFLCFSLVDVLAESVSPKLLYGSVD